MKVKTLSALAGLGGALIMCSSADAAFLGLSVESYNVTLAAGPRTVHRVYADFSSPNDILTTWGALNTELVLQNILEDGSLSINGFQNPGGGGDLPPTSGQVLYTPALAHDSFYTVNLTLADQNPDPQNYPLLMVGMPTIATGANTLYAPIDSAAVTTTPDSPFALAGWSGQNRVLLAQLTVVEGEHVRGLLGINVIGPGVIIATFNSVPAPGALALLGLAGLVGTRRRRA